MRFKKFVRRADIRKLRPALHGGGRRVQVIDLRTPHGQEEGGVRRDHELAPEKPRRVFQKVAQFDLPHRGKAVLRLVQQVQAGLLQAAREVKECALPVGLFARVLGSKTILMDIAKRGQAGNREA